MRNPLVALTVLVTLAGAGCASDSDDDGGPPGDDGGDGGGGDDAPPFTAGVSTLSGSAEAGYADGPRGKARFANPVNVAVGPDGHVYVADFDNNKIRVVNAEDGSTSTLIANGIQRPFAMAFAPDGTLYVSSDRDPQGASGPMAGTIWQIDVAARAATPIVARVGRPRGLAVLPDGTLAASDYQHHVIQRVDPRTGAVTLLAGAWDVKGALDGPGATARLAVPYGMAFVNGGLVVADLENHRLRRVELDGRVSTLAGSTAGYADGGAGSARFDRPQAVTAAASGDLYIADAGNHRIRRLRGGSVQTIAGSGEAGYLDHDDPLQAKLFAMEGLAVTPDGSRLFIADGSGGEPLPYHRIRRVELR